MSKRTQAIAADIKARLKDGHYPHTWTPRFGPDPAGLDGGMRVAYFECSSCESKWVPRVTNPDPPEDAECAKALRFALNMARDQPELLAKYRKQIKDLKARITRLEGMRREQNDEHGRKRVVFPTPLGGSWGGAE